MATALDVLTRALRLAGILDAIETPAAEDGQAALAAMNGLMAGLELQGVRLGHVPLALADTVNLPLSHIEMLMWLLASRLAIEFGVAMRPELLPQIAAAEQALRATYFQVPEMAPDPALLATSARAAVEQRTW